MSTIQIPRVEAQTVVRVLTSGRTTPCLMLCQDASRADYEIVVKWRAAMELKETGLVCELMASLLAEDLDLPVPKPFLVHVDAQFNLSEGKPKLSTIVRESAGLNFGSQKLPAGFATWSQDKPIPGSLRQLAAEVFAFDVLIQNVDRRREKPNLLWSGDELYLYDHEQAFSFLMGVIGWQPPWTGQGTSSFATTSFSRTWQAPARIGTASTAPSKL